MTESDCFKIGELTVDLSDLTGSKSDRGILVALCFGGTESQLKQPRNRLEKFYLLLQYDCKSTKLLEVSYGN